MQPARPRSTGGRGGRGGNTQVVGGRGGPFVYHGGASTGMNNGVQKVEQGFAPPIPAVGPGQYLILALFTFHCCSHSKLMLCFTPLKQIIIIKCTCNHCRICIIFMFTALPVTNIRSNTIELTSSCLAIILRGNFVVAVQYGGHPPGGIPLPAVGMAMPNYSGQPQYGFPNSEVTWYASSSPFSSSYIGFL